MIELSNNGIVVSEDIADTSCVIIFDNEELILTEIDIKQFNHSIRKNDSIQDGHEFVWSLYYHVDANYFNENLTRNVLIEKTYPIYAWLYWKYNFYEPIEIIGKGSDVPKYENLFSEIKANGGTYIPEKTLILKRSNK